MKRIVAFLALLCLLGALTACAKPAPSPEIPKAETEMKPEGKPDAEAAVPPALTPAPEENETQPEPEAPADEEPKSVPELSELVIRQAASYEEIYQHLVDQAERNSYIARYATDDAAEAEAPAEKAAAADVIGTNVQIAGFDEADIVKTDGKNIYMICSSELQIVRADGPVTRELGKCFVTDENAEIYENPTGLYVCGDTAIVLIERNGSIERILEDGSYSYEYRNETVARYFDVSDPMQIRRLGSFVQDGWYRDSRLHEGKLYLVTEFPAWWNIRKDDPAYCVPCTGVDTDQKPLDPEQVYLTDADESVYMVTTVLDAQSQEQLASNAVLGSYSCFYMDDAGLYLASTSRQTLQSEPYQEKQYRVVAHRNLMVTDLYRLSAEDLSIEATGRVEGSPLSSYALQASGDTLRIVTSEHSSEYLIYYDDAYGFENYVWKTSEENCSFYVLGSDLQPVSELRGLAEGERVYSVRYLGDVAYFVTFRQTDPLFAVDVSDPAHPEILSELKIDGFSTYLHPFGDGLLFGLGREADAETGAVGNLKLSMFDVSDPRNVTEQTRKVLDTDYTEALYNPHAIVVSAEKNLIAFPTDNGYGLYEYRDGAFEEKASMTVRGFFRPWNIRAVCIDGVLYICDCIDANVTAVDIETMQFLTDIVVAMG